MKRRHVVLVSVVVLAVLGSVRTARANMSPPLPPAGGLLGSGESSTYVQMVSEEVLMTIGDRSMDVKATFHMLNQGTREEVLDVGFPIGFHWIYPDGTEGDDWGIDPDSFTIYVEGYKTSFITTRSEDNYTIWATWQVTFPPQEMVNVEISYKSYSTLPYSTYSYILQTGAGWYGTIGEGTITIRLPYEINEYNILDIQGDLPAYALTDTEIIWHFTRLEPRWGSDIYVYVMSPRFWREWEEAEKEVEENPDSVSAHLRLAHALGDVSYDPHEVGCIRSNCELFDRAMQEYRLWLNVIPDEYVQQVIPNIIDYHLDYMRLLTAPWNMDWVPVCPEIERVLALDPANKVALREKERFEWCAEETLHPTATLYSPPGCEPRAGRCPPPTATPTATPTQTPSPTMTPFVPSPTASATLAATPTPTPLPTPPPADTSKIGVWVAIAAAVIGGAWVGVRAYRRKPR